MSLLCRRWMTMPPPLRACSAFSLTPFAQERNVLGCVAGGQVNNRTNDRQFAINSGDVSHRPVRRRIRPARSIKLTPYCGGVTAKATCRDGVLLDPSTL